MRAAAEIQNGRRRADAAAAAAAAAAADTDASRAPILRRRLCWCSAARVGRRQKGADQLISGALTSARDADAAAAAAIVTWRPTTATQRREWRAGGTHSIQLVITTNKS